MKSRINNQNFISLKIGQIILVIGFLVCLGWIFNIELLKSILPGYPTMKFNTALGFIFLSIWYLLQITKAKGAHIFSFIVGFLVILIGLGHLTEDIFDLQLGIDHLFVKDLDVPNEPNTFPGRMSSLTSVCFVLFGIAIILIQNGSIKLVKYGQFLLCNVATFSFVAFLGYIFSVPSLVKLSLLTSMAVHTSLLFLVLSILIQLLNRNVGMISMFTSNEIGNSIARKLFIRLTFIMVFFAYILLFCSRYDLISYEFGMVIMVISFIITSLFLLIYTSNELNKLNSYKQIAEKDSLAMRTFLNATPDPIVIVDNSGKIRVTNELTEKVFGYAHLELIDKQLNILIPNTSRAKHSDHMQMYFANPKARGMGTGMLLKALKKDGAEFPVEISLNPVEINGEIWVAAAIRDISFRIDLTTKVEKSYEQFLVFFNLNPIPTIIEELNANKISYVNNAFLKLFSMQREDVIDKTANELKLHQSNHNTTLLNNLVLDNLIQNGSETVLFDAKGQAKNVLINSGNIELEDKQYILTKIVDLTERIKDEARLKDLTNRLTLATKNAQIGIWELDLISDTLIWDDIMYQIYGVTKSTFPIKFTNWKQYLHAQDINKVEHEFNIAISQKKPLDTEFRIVWPDGSIHFIRIKALVQYDANDKPINIIGTNWDITVQRIAELNEEKSKRYRIFIDQAPNAIAMFDKDMRYMAASEKWISGYHIIGDIIGKSHYEVFPEIGEDWKAIHRECLTGKTNQCDEALFVRANGTKQWLSWDIRPWYLENEDIGGIIIYTLDITKKKLSDELLHISETSFRENFENAAIGMAILSEQGKWLKVNSKVCEIVGYSEDELLNICFNEITHPEDLPTQLSNIQDLINGKGNHFQMEKRYIHKNGKIVYVILAVAIIHDSHGRILHFISQIIDISELKQAKFLLEESIVKKQGILDASTHVAIIETDTNGLITTFNKGAECLLGYKAEEIVNRHTPLLFHQKGEIELRSQELSTIYDQKIEGFDVFIWNVKSGKQETREWTYLNKNGNQFVVQLTFTCVMHGENTVGYLGVATDISEIIENKKKLLKSKENLEILTENLTNRNKQLANFAHITSHNLRAPVSNLNALLTMYNQTEGIENQNLLLEKFKIVIHHLTSTLNSLVETLKIRELGIRNLEKISFKHVLAKTEAMISSQLMESNAQIITDFENAPIIEYNLEYLESIFLNLLTNAIKYRSPERQPIIRFKTEVMDGRITLSVQDNGLGIDLSRHGHKLFGLHKTFHRNSDANGVGLFLTKTQIEAMGGTISAQSEVNVGTTFIINF